MSHPMPAFQEHNLPDERVLQSKLDLLALYDRYAPALLGVITTIVTDNNEAIRLLEETFISVQADFTKFQAGKQPLFTWLLSIARCKALDALKERKQKLAPVLSITTTGTIVSLPANTTVAPAPTNFSTNSTAAQLKTLLDSVLFKNCTPEEAAAAVGLPVETARQQLRLAMQQMRSQRKS